MKKLILVNGIPASGKSSVSRIIAERFNIPVLSIDEIKEPFMVQFSEIIDRPLNRKLGYAAYESMFNIVKIAPPDSVFILDAWFGFREKSVLADYLELCGAKKTIEIWNKISPERVADRYKSRCTRRVKAQPMGIGDIYTVDQDAEIDNEGLISWVSNHVV